MTHNIQNYLSFKARNYVQDSDKKNISGDNSGSMFFQIYQQQQQWRLFTGLNKKGKII